MNAQGGGGGGVGGHSWSLTVVLTKYVGGIVGHFVLKDRGDALHAHTGVHMLGRQALQATISLPVELHPQCLAC